MTCAISLVICPQDPPGQLLLGSAMHDQRMMITERCGWAGEDAAETDGHTAESGSFGYG